MNIKAIIRALVMRGHGGKIRDLLLLPAQIDLVKRIEGTTTSRDLATVDGITIHHANGKLERLRRGGYLQRSAMSDPTGGVYYEYSRTGVKLCKT